MLLGRSKELTVRNSLHVMISCTVTQVPCSWKRPWQAFRFLNNFHTVQKQGPKYRVNLPAVASVARAVRATCKEASSTTSGLSVDTIRKLVVAIIQGSFNIPHTMSPGSVQKRDAVLTCHKRKHTTFLSIMTTG